MVDAKEIIKKYYPKGKARKIIIKHGKDVRDLALEICDKHPELVVDREFIAEAAMLHDIGCFMVDAPDIHCLGEYPYIAHGYLGSEILEKEGLPRHALVCERHTGVGLSKKMIEKRDLPIPLRSMKPKSIEEKIICFADLFYSKTSLGDRKSVEVVEAKLAKHGEKNVKKFRKWCKKFL